MVNETTKPEKQSAADVHEGDEVLMSIRWHGDMHAGHYEESIRRCVVEGTVTEAPRADDDWTRDGLREGKRLLVDFTVETEDGKRFTWNVDNGYVIGQHPELGRVTDLGHFGGLYKR